VFFPEEFIRQVRDENNILDVISNYVSLKKGGANYKGLCPFHTEKTPSFMVNPSKQIFHCFGCGEGGDVFRFLMRYENMGFPEAVSTLAERCGRALPRGGKSSEDTKKKREKERIFEVNRAALDFFSEARLRSRSVGGYLKKRGISRDSIEVFSIGYAPDSWNSLFVHLKSAGFSEAEMEGAGLILRRKDGNGYYDRFRNRMMFPIVDVRGHVLGFGGRVMDDSTPKYLNSPETAVFDKGANLYGLNLAYEAIRRQDYAILVEGYMDVITVHQHGVANVVATLGTALTVRHIRKLKRYTRNVAVFFDSDDAGIKAAVRSFDLCVPEGMKVKVVSLEAGEDPDSFIRKAGRDGFSDRMSQARPIMDFMMDRVLEEELPKGIPGRVAAAERLLAMLAKIPNPLERELYLEQTARRLEFDLNILKKSGRVRVAKIREKSHALEKRDLQSDRKPPVWEGILVGVMVNHPERIREVQDQVEAGQFSDPGLRFWVERLFALPEEKRTAEEIRSLIRSEEPSRVGLVSGFLVEDYHPEDLPGLLLRLKVEYLRRVKKKLQRELQTAEKQGREEESSRLVRKISRLALEVESLQKQIGSERRNMAECRKN